MLAFTDAAMCLLESFKHFMLPSLLLSMPPVCLLESFQHFMLPSLLLKVLPVCLLNISCFRASFWKMPLVS